ncbi:MAG: GHKL domain-containing protein [Bacillota bacterium]
MGNIPADGAISSKRKGIGAARLRRRPAAVFEHPVKKGGGNRSAASALCVCLFTLCAVSAPGSPQGAPRGRARESCAASPRPRPEQACERVTAPDARFLSAETRLSGGQLLIKIENACNGSSRQEDGRYISAKTGLEHGMGLLNIQKVMNAYGGFLKAEDGGTKFTLMAAFPVSIDPFSQ